MCVVSMVMDFYHDRWYPRRPLPYEVEPEPSWPVIPLPTVPLPPMPVKPRGAPNRGVLPVSPEEVEEFRELLQRAREYDRRNSEPDCETESKKKRLKALADELGVEIDFV